MSPHESSSTFPVYSPAEALTHCRRLQRERGSDRAAGLFRRDRAVFRPQLVELLEHADDSDAAPLLWGMIAIRLYEPYPEMVEPVAALLKRTGDPEVRTLAVRALGISREKTAVASLLPWLKADDPFFREEVIWALGRINDRAAQPALRELLAAPDARTRMSAVEVLRRWDDLEDREALDAALQDPSWSVGSAANYARNLPRGWENAPERHVDNGDWILSPYHLECPESFDPVHLEQHLSEELEPDPAVRKWVRETLAGIQARNRRKRPAPAGRIARLVPYSPELTRVGLRASPLPCPGCGGGGHEVLSVPGEAIGRPDRPVRLIRCQECQFEGPHYVFWHDGDPVRIVPDGFERDTFHGGVIEGPQASLVWEPVPAKRGWKGSGSDTLAGTPPAWVQSEDWPLCPTCRADMQFVLQLSSHTLDTVDHASELSGEFCLFLENYATFYLFECSACQVTASVSQCT